jgi:hypothetical protein
MYFAQLSRLSQFNSLMKIRDAAALCARLKNPACFAERIGQAFAIVDGDSTRLFALNIFSGPC